MATIKVFEIEALTPGGRHVWYKTDKGRIRKPYGNFDNLDFSECRYDVVFVEKELQHWGKWALKCTVGGLGYPSQSVLVTALQGSPGTGGEYLPNDPRAEHLDAIIKRIHSEKPRWAEVLRKHYMRELDETLEEVAKGMEIPGRTYRYYLQLGRKRVEFYLKNT